MRRSLAVALLAASAIADEPPPLTLCLAGAADQSPVCPLKDVPGNHRELVVAFRLRAGESFKNIQYVWTLVDVGELAPPNTEFSRGSLALHGSARGTLKYKVPEDFPVGKYRIDVSADGKPWASLEFAVTGTKEATPLEKPEDLLPLEPGTSWTYSWVLEPGPIAKNVTVAGAEKGEDGKFRTTTTLAVAAKEDGLARIEMRRGGQVVTEEWWSLTDKGLAVTQVRAGDQTAPYDPPLPMIALPLKSPSTWTYKPTVESPEMEYRMWGPLPVQTPSGETPGWIVLIKTLAGKRISTVERHYAPGVGVVREVHTDAVGPDLLTRIETALLPAK